MNKNVDCLFIGHNEFPFNKYEKNIRRLGKESAYYRDLKKDFIQKEDLKTMQDIFSIDWVRNRPHMQELRAYGNVFNQAIAYLGTFLAKEGFSFKYINTFQENKDKLRELIEEISFKCVIIPTTHYMWALPIIEIVKFVRKLCPKMQIIIGGPYITNLLSSNDEKNIEYQLKLIDANYYINDLQGETALSNLVGLLDEPNKIYDLSNVIINDEKIYYGKFEPENNILEENMINWSLFEDDLDYIVSMRTSVSCPFHCSFCGFPERAGKYRMVDIRIILEQLKQLDKIKQVKCVFFTDDTFNVPSRRFKELLNLMIEEKLDLKWVSFLRCQFLDEETVVLMKKSGCIGVYIGIESGNQAILDNMRKAATVDKYKQGLYLLNKYKIISFASLVVGFPGETAQTVQDTVDFIERYQPTFYRPHLWLCDTITPIWDRKEEFNICGKQYEWSHSTMTATEACDLIDEMCKKIHNAILMPQHMFDFTSIVTLLCMGCNLDFIKEKINQFNVEALQK